MKVPCPGCKVLFEDIEGARFPYGTSSPGCWKAYTELLGYEHSLPTFPQENRLSVDAYAVQHPQNFPLQNSLGVSERHKRASVQSVIIHLIALYAALEKKVPLQNISTIMDRILKRKSDYEPLDPPANLGSLTVADFSPEMSEQDYKIFTKKWAQKAWHAWAPYHDPIKQLYAQYMS